MFTSVLHRACRPAAVLRGVPMGVLCADACRVRACAVLCAVPVHARHRWRGLSTTSRSPTAPPSPPTPTSVSTDRTSNRHQPCKCLAHQRSPPFRVLGGQTRGHRWDVGGECSALSVDLMDLLPPPQLSHLCRYMAYVAKPTGAGQTPNHHHHQQHHQQQQRPPRPWAVAPTSGSRTPGTRTPGARTPGTRTMSRSPSGSTPYLESTRAAYSRQRCVCSAHPTTHPASRAVSSE